MKEKQPSTESSAALIWLGIAAVLAIVFAIIYFIKQSSQKPQKKPTSSQSAAPIAPRGADNAAPVRRRRAMRVNRRQEEEDDIDIDGFSDEEPEAIPLLDEDGKKFGAKKMRKMEMKAEKREARQNEEQEREEKKLREAQKVVDREKDELARREREKEQEELEQLRKEEQERKEHEEYLKLKEAFTIEEVGEIGILTEEESQSLLQEFVDYVKDQKVLPLEDLASHFNLKVQDVIERIENLTEMGRLTGVMDDRGKFIYISEEELVSVAKFIQQRGRVSISDLAESSNQLIRMVPNNVAKANSVEITAS